MTSTRSRYHVADLKAPGLQLTVDPSGVKTFTVYRKIDHASERIQDWPVSCLIIEQAQIKAQRLG